ncbi:MAG: MerR family transcriptional regulator, partial [Pseudomonadota bacterium]
MKTRYEEYSVGQLARLAGVSVRTLHHYDDIGLLKPAHVGANGYRLYGRIELLRLQEIMFYRDVGLSLDEVERLLDGPANAVERLIRHRDRLQEDSLRTARIIDTLNATIAHLKGEKDMALNDLYTPFSDRRQAEYEKWLVNEYGPDMAARIATSKAAVEQLPDGMAGAMQRLKDTETRLVAAYEA